MSNQTFDFETFNAMYNQAIAGLADTISAVKDIIPQVQEVAKQTGSAKLTKTTESFAQVTEETIACFASVEESAEEVKRIYSRIDTSVN